MYKRQVQTLPRAIQSSYFPRTPLYDGFRERIHSVVLSAPSLDTEASQLKRWLYRERTPLALLGLAAHRGRFPSARSDIDMEPCTCRR